jgi:hypothetical protein
MALETEKFPLLCSAIQLYHSIDMLSTVILLVTRMSNLYISARPPLFPWLSTTKIPLWPSLVLINLKDSVNHTIIVTTVTFKSLHLTHWYSPLQCITLLRPY